MIESQSLFPILFAFANLASLPPSQGLCIAEQPGIAFPQTLILYCSRLEFANVSYLHKVWKRAGEATILRRQLQSDWW